MTKLFYPTIFIAEVRYICKDREIIFSFNIQNKKMNRELGFQLIILSLIFVTCEGLCDQRPYGGQKLCCPGTNNSCTAPKRNQTGGLAGGTCYCDDYCLTSNDCCPDFRIICKGKF